MAHLFFFLTKDEPTSSSPKVHCLQSWCCLFYGFVQRQIQSLGQEDPWKRKWQPTPVFLLGESHAQRSLVGYGPWGHKESDMTEET